jgi:hypothetical protein
MDPATTGDPNAGRYSHDVRGGREVVPAHPLADLEAGQSGHPHVEQRHVGLERDDGIERAALPSAASPTTSSSGCPPIRRTMPPQ